MSFLASTVLVTHDIKRVLVIDGTRVLVAAICDYLAFRGLRIDRAEGVGDAQALARHLTYDAVVLALPDGEAEAHALQGVIRDVRTRHQQARVYVLVDDEAPGAGAFCRDIGADHMLSTGVPMAHLARLLCHSIAA